jgi:lipoprotein-anchoring transpeptidase ErfK/SrfK
MWRSRLTLSADLSARTLELRRGAKLLRRIPVAIGGPSTPTPIGRFTVTDKLIPDRSVAYYGCCLLALSGHQPKLRPGWAGGDRIAIHGGAANRFAGSSAGCLRADEKDLRVLMKVVPLGTPVVIRA